jgi:hypothetical protein
MKAVANSFWLKKGYDALTFFGVILTCSAEDAERINRLHSPTPTGTETATPAVTPAAARLTAALKNHEMIHLRQAQSCHNSWLCFYLRYAYYWLCGQRLCRKLKNAGYWLNPFEMEAYEHMYDKHYLANADNGTNGWRTYARLSAKERLEKVKREKLRV